jgi:hypothetical protein
MMFSKLKSVGVAGGLLAGLMLGGIFAAAFSAGPRAIAQAEDGGKAAAQRSLPAVQRFQMAIWSYPPGPQTGSSRGAYILDTHSGKVWEVREGNPPKLLGGGE